MKLQIFIYECARCGHRVEALSVPGGGYGIFLLRTRSSGELAYLDAFADAVFSEAESILLEAPTFANKDSFERARLLHALFGLTCDRAASGEQYQVAAHPWCPKCGSSEMNWAASEPPRLEEVNLAPVSHDYWSSLPSAAKRALLNTALSGLPSDGRIQAPS